MTAHISAYGRLGRDPESRETSNKKPMAFGALAVTAGEDATIWLKLLAFGRAADALGKHKKGELIGVLGRLVLNQWTDRDGNDREDLQVIVDQLHSSRTVRPGGGKRRTNGDRPSDKQQAAPPKRTAGEPEFDDDIPF